jgi:hypothetical protein
MEPHDVLQSYEARSADLMLDLPELQLGEKNDQHDIRTIITNREMKSIGLNVVGQVHRVGYGVWDDAPACLLAMKFDFRLADQRLPFDHFEISITFEKSASVTHENAHHPIVRCLTPCKIHGYTFIRRRVRKWRIEKLSWDSSSRANASFEQAMDEEYEHDTSVLGKPWVPTRREKPHQAVWTVTNDAKNENWPLLDELGLSIVVEHGGPFEANVTISGFRSHRRLARILSPTWWSKDAPLLFNGKTCKRAAPRASRFNELNDTDWVQITPFPGLNPDPQAHTEKHVEQQTEKHVPKDTVYRVRGIPFHYDDIETSKLLCSICKVGADRVKIGSLAKCPHHDEKMATVTFPEPPSVLDTATRDEWVFKFHPSTTPQDSSSLLTGKVSEVLYIVIDTHFRGFTSFGIFKSTSEHKME